MRHPERGVNYDGRCGSREMVGGVPVAFALVDALFGR
jgi:hypothetical protein